MVYDPEKVDAQIDRGVTLLLVSLEVGPYIKRIREATGIPHTFINNASWVLHQLGRWKRGRGNTHVYYYPWYSSYHRGEPEGIEGLTDDAITIAGVDPDGWVWSAQRSYKRGRAWETLPPPPCGTSAALGRHRIKDETCNECQQAEEARRRDWLKRKARIIKQRREYAQRRADLDVLVDADAWEDLLKAHERVSVWSPVSMDAVIFEGNRPTTRHDVMARIDPRDRHNLEWQDPTLDAVLADEAVIQSAIDAPRKERVRSELSCK